MSSAGSMITSSTTSPTTWATSSTPSKIGSKASPTFCTTSTIGSKTEERSPTSISGTPPKPPPSVMYSIKPSSKDSCKLPPDTAVSKAAIVPSIKSGSLASSVGIPIASKLSVIKLLPPTAKAALSGSWLPIASISCVV